MNQTLRMKEKLQGKFNDQSFDCLNGSIFNRARVGGETNIRVMHLEH